MKTTDLKNSPRFRAPAVHIALGTMGIMNATHAAKAEVKFGIPLASRIPVLAIETAESARSYSAPVGTDLPSVSLPDEAILILRDRTTQDLAAMAQRLPKTRSYARKLGALPPTSTREGAGGHRILSLTSFLAELPELDLRIPRILTQERDRCRFAAQCDDGNAQSGSDEMAVYITGAGYGSTCSGAALLIASRVRHHSRLLGLKVRVHLVLVSASVAKTYDSSTAWANFGVTCRAAMKAMETLGYIARKQLPGNRKNVYVYLTAKGRALKRKLVPLAVQTNQLAVQGLSAVNVQTARCVLLAMVENLAHDELTIDQTIHPKKTGIVGKKKPLV